MLTSDSSFFFRSVLAYHNLSNGQAPSGAAAFGTELGAEGDAARERRDALNNGENLPAERQNLPDGPSIGMNNGLEKGVEQFSEGERNDMQNERNQTNKSDQRESKVKSRQQFSTFDSLLQVSATISLHLSLSHYLFLNSTADLASIARTSGGAGSFNPKMNQSEFVSTGASNPSQVLGTASASTGTDSGTGAAGLGGQGVGGPGGDNVAGSAPGASFN